MYLNDRLWKKAYLLEFKRNGIVTDAFTFSVPPQSEEFTFPQRISETKTFGGSVIDDYGNDTVKINLQGTTINQELKIIYCSTKGMKFLTGEQEVFYLQKLIKEYGKIDKLSGKQVFLYQLNSGTKAFSNKWWEVYIQDFQIRRSKDAPLTYNYTISFLAQPEATKKLSSLASVASWIDSIQTQINNCITAINNGIEILNSALDYYKQALNIIASIKDCVEKVDEACSQYVAIINNFSEVTKDIFKETVSLGNSIYKSAERIRAQYPYSVFNEVKELASFCSDLSNNVREIEEDEISSNLTEQYGQTSKEIHDVWITVANDVENESLLIYYLAEKLTSSIGFAINPGNSDTDDSAYLTCGYMEIQVQENMTWDAIALKYYGNADYGAIIACYNMGKELETGSSIFIPFLGQTELQNLSNEVLNRPDVKDNYGKDINLTVDNDLAVSNGDFSIVNSQNNLNQAIRNRLTSSVGSRVRDETYGIRESIGDPTAASSFILSSIEQTLLEEPRIKSIDNISFTGKGDNIQVQVDYTDINDKKQTYGGTI